MPSAFALFCRSNVTGGSIPPRVLAADAFALEQGEDALGHGVVVTVAAMAHRGLQIKVFRE